MVSNIVLLPCLNRIKFLNFVRHGSSATFGAGLILFIFPLVLGGVFWSGSNEDFMCILKFFPLFQNIFSDRSFGDHVFKQFQDSS